PFGRRSLTLAHVSSQMVATARLPEKIVHKWKIFHAICTARPRLGVSERSLSVLDALLTFHPETALTGEDDLIVFPSNHQLSLRAHGMPASTLRRHLAVLVDAGLIVRRDSPNGKRYARKGRAGEIELAFGFDLSPLVVRSEEFENLAA
ncbi:plasmid replication protein RepC, partial [Neisseria gonorrhoeae]